jgi:imidazolonepropionase-like amidohydrolase
LIEADRLIVRAGEVIESASVRIERGRIVAVGAGIEVPEGARRMKASVVCSGFLDPWSALAVDGTSLEDLETTPATRAIDGFDAWGQRHLQFDSLRGGVTASRIQAGLRSPMAGLGAIVRNAPELTLGEQGILIPDACLASGVGLPRQGRLPDPFERIADVDRLVGQLESGRQFLQDSVEYRHDLSDWEKAIEEKKAQLEKDFKKAKKDREKKKKEAEGKDKGFEDEKYKEDKKPKAPRYDEDGATLARVANGELPLVVEVHRSAEIRALLDRTAAFDRLRLVLAGASESLPFADELRERRIPVIVYPGPSRSQLWYAPEEIDMSLAAELDQAGVAVMIGSGGLANARDLRLIAAHAVGHGLHPERALAAITTEPARTFDLGSRFGSVERGMDADLLLLSGDPLESATRVEAVIAAGRVVLE